MMELMEVDAVTVITFLVGAVFVVVMLGDARKWLAKAEAPKPAPKPASPPPASPPSEPPRAAASPEAASSPEASAPSSPRDASETGAEEEKEVPPTPAQPEPARPRSDSEKKQEAALEDLLDSAFEDLDAEENIVDQAWDNVHKDQYQVSTHVGGLNDLIQTGMKAMQEASERNKQQQKEAAVEKSREERSHRLKVQGNAAYAKKDYSNAISLYTSAITLLPDADPTKHILFSNRAAANFYAGRLGAAMTDSEKCVKLNPKFIKGHMRKGYVYEERKEYQAAVDVFKRVIEDFPGDKMLEEAQEHLAACQEKLDDQLLSMCDDVLDDLALPSNVQKSSSPLD